MTEKNTSEKNSFGSSVGHIGLNQTGELITVLQEWYLELYKSTAAMRLIAESWESSPPSEPCATLKRQLLYDLDSISTQIKGIMENLRTAKEVCLSSPNKIDSN